MTREQALALAFLRVPTTGHMNIGVRHPVRGDYPTHNAALERLYTAAFGAFEFTSEGGRA